MGPLEGRSEVHWRVGLRSIGGSVWVPWGLVWDTLASVWGPCGVGLYPVISSQYILLTLFFSIR